MSGRIDPSKWIERQEWVRQQQASGLSVAEFCREHGLHVGNFYAWKHKLAGELQGQSQSVAGKSGTGKSGAGKSGTGGKSFAGKSVAGDRAMRTPNWPTLWRLVMLPKSESLGRIWPATCSLAEKKATREFAVREVSTSTAESESVRTCSSLGNPSPATAWKLMFA